MLLRCADEMQAAAAFERLLVATEGYAFPQVGTITVSIGFTRVRPDDNPGAAFGRADKAVHRAKAHECNQVANYSALVQEGNIKEDLRRSDVGLF